MDTINIYRVISFTGKSAEEMDNMLNVFLREEADITPLSISTFTFIVKQEDAEQLQFTGTLLYSFKD